MLNTNAWQSFFKCNVSHCPWTALQLERTEPARDTLGLWFGTRCLLWQEWKGGGLQWASGELLFQLLVEPKENWASLISVLGCSVDVRGVVTVAPAAFIHLHDRSVPDTDLAFTTFPSIAVDAPGLTLYVANVAEDRWCWRPLQKYCSFWTGADHN